VVCPIGMDRSEAVKAEAERIYGALLANGVDAILDDRGERPGAMFADWELIGVPHRITIGDKGLKDGLVEYQHRRDAEATRVAVADITAPGCELRSRRQAVQRLARAAFVGVGLSVLPFTPAHAQWLHAVD